MGARGVGGERAVHGMDEFYVLLEEHAAARAALLGLERAAYAPLPTRELLQCLERLTTRVHLPKEDRVVLARLRPPRGCAPPWLEVFLTQRQEAQDALRCTLDRACTPGAAAGAEFGNQVAEVMLRLGGLMDAEESLVFPALYDRCSDAERWKMAVELDRAVDQEGRAERARALAACWT